MRIHYCGVRGSLPAAGVEFARYGGHTSSLALAHDGTAGPTLILDAGTGLVRAAALMNGEPFAGTILLTHLHWDHVIGLPFCSSTDHPDARTTVLLPEQRTDATAAQTLAGMMSPPYFPVGPTELRGDWSHATIGPGEHEIEGFRVLAREIPHKGGRTFGYRVSDGRSAIAYMPDHCPTTLGPGEDGFGEYHPAALQLAHDVDVLVHDAQLLGPEQAGEASFGHTIADYAVALGARAGAREVVLFHHGPNRTDEELDGLARRLGSDGSSGPRVSVARESTVTEL